MEKEVGCQYKWLSVQFTSVDKSSLTLCDPMNHSKPGLPVHHQLLEFTQSHIHRVSDAIQPSHPLSSPSPPAPNPSQCESFPLSQLFAWGGQSIGVSALASVLPKNTQGWSPSEWTGWISMQWWGSHKPTRKCVLMASYCKAKRNPLCSLCMIILWSP